MLTWKIFMMSMVSLTLQMDPLDEGSSSNSSPFWIRDTDSGIYYPSILNLSNPFSSKLNLDAHICFAIIRMYCRTEKDDVTSDDCAKQGILYYKRKENEPLRRHPRDPMSWLDDFFDKLSLKRADFDLPEEFCSKQKAPPNITKDILDRELAGFPLDYKASTCIDDLKEFSAKMHPLMKKPNNYVKTAIYLSRQNIANFALHYKATLGLHKKSFQFKYLKHISEHVSSSNCMNQIIFYYDK